jgi:hypothetical protein
MKEPSKIQKPQFLSGWKEIANYLGKGVRTVQRYERQLGLPVRRPAGKPWGSVVATKAELDAWVSASPIREVFELSGRDFQGEYEACSQRIRHGLERMMRLRDQMLALRNDVRASVGVLRNSVHELQGALNQNRWIESRTSPSSLSYIDVENPEDLPLLDTADYPKAS